MSYHHSHAPEVAQKEVGGEGGERRYGSVQAAQDFAPEGTRLLTRGLRALQRRCNAPRVSYTCTAGEGAFCAPRSTRRLCACARSTTSKEPSVRPHNAGHALPLAALSIDSGGIAREVVTLWVASRVHDRVTSRLDYSVSSMVNSIMRVDSGSASGSLCVRGMDCDAASRLHQLSLESDRVFLPRRQCTRDTEGVTGI